jgi:hypothetical protein
MTTAGPDMTRESSLHHPGGPVNEALGMDGTTATPVTQSARGVRRRDDHG